MLYEVITKDILLMLQTTKRAKMTCFIYIWPAFYDTNFKTLKMKIVVLDGYTLNPGDLSWNAITELGDCKIYDRTPKEP